MTETWLELATLLAAGLAAGRVVAMPAARRELRERPRLLVALGVVIAVCLAIVVWAALDSQLALRIVTACTAAGWVFLAWRARPRYGRARGLPPGSFSLRSSLAAIADRSFLERRFRQHGHVFKMAQFHRPVVCVIGLAEGRRLLRRFGTDLVPPALPLSSAIPRGFIRYMSPDDHELYSRLLRAGFSVQVVDASEPFARAEARKALQSLAGATSGLNPRRAVLGYVTSVSLRLMFGDLFDSQDAQRIEAWSRDAEVADGLGRPSGRATGALEGFGELLRERAETATPSVDTSVWSELVASHPDAARDATLAGNLFLLLQASRESITGLVLWCVKLLSDSPVWVARLREGRSTVNDVVQETLRLAQSEYVYRRVVRPIEIDRYRIPADWLLRICVAESHRQEPPFERPGDFDPRRFESGPFTTREYSPFGLDEHACLGARMSLLLAATFLDELVQGFEWSVVSDGPPERANRHWRHWAPSSAFQVAVEVSRPAEPASGCGRRAGGPSPARSRS